MPPFLALPLPFHQRLMASRVAPQPRSQRAGRAAFKGAQRCATVPTRSAAFGVSSSSHK